jgi:LemA protein
MFWADLHLSLLWWLGLAVLLFWCVGLYNRIMRIRARGLGAFGSIEKYLRTMTQTVETHVAAAGTDVPEYWSPLLTQMQVVESACKGVRGAPLEPKPLEQLGHAIDVLQAHWKELRDGPSDLAGSPVPEALQQQWEDLSTRLQAAREAFNQILARYNEAMQQFPASLVVASMGFKPAGQL